MIKKGLRSNVGSGPRSLKAGRAEYNFRVGLGVVISLAYFFHLAFCGLFSYEVWMRDQELDYYELFFYGAVIIYPCLLLLGLWRRINMGIWGVGGVFVGPVQQGLRRVADLSRFNPWIKFGVFMFILLTFSFVGLACVVAVSEPADSTIVSIIGGGLGFLVCCALYYKRYVLNPSASALLFTLHPRGIEMIEDS
jgi:hypothetical protein